MIPRFVPVAAILGLAALFAAQPLLPKHEAAKAASAMWCQSAQSAAGGGRRVSGLPTGSIVQLNGMGCGLFQAADFAVLVNRGFSPGPQLTRPIIFTTGTWTGTTTFQVGRLPPSTYIQHIIASNSTANAVTGGIAVGTTSGGADVVAALDCAANCLSFVADSALLKRVFSTTNPQPLFVTPVTAGNNANVTVTVVAGYF